MKKLKYLPLLLIVGVLTCCFLFGMAEYELGKTRELGGFDDHGLALLSGASAPAGGTCDNVGVAYDDNPFSGWPTDFHPGNWNIISAWYCDPNYFPGATHWGIDLARLTWEIGIDGEPALVTTEDAVVTASSGCLGRDNKGADVCPFNSGMGNYVSLQALACEMVCEDPLGTLAPHKEPFIQCEEVCEKLNWHAYYFHLLDVTVETGQRVERGDVVGHIDNNGRSTGPHLHYQINGPNGPVDPAPTMADYGKDLRGSFKGKR